MCCIHNPLILENGVIRRYTKEEIDKANKHLNELEDSFWKRFPDINIDDLDFLSHWYDFVYCETEEDVQRVFKLIEDENRKREEYYKNKKTSFWRKFFGY